MPGECCGAVSNAAEAQKGLGRSATIARMAIVNRAGLLPAICEHYAAIVHDDGRLHGAVSRLR
jgi:hypothetical protein